MIINEEKTIITKRKYQNDQESKKQHRRDKPIESGKQMWNQKIAKNSN